VLLVPEEYATAQELADDLTAQQIGDAVDATG
jgi:hypothetical protein